MTARPCRAHALPACAECATLSLDFVDGYPRDLPGPAAHTEAIRLLDEMAAAPDDSGPLVLGGQGRDAEEVVETAEALWHGWTFLLGLAIGALVGTTCGAYMGAWLASGTLPS